MTIKKILIALLIGFGIYGFIEKTPNPNSPFTNETVTSNQPIASDHSITTETVTSNQPIASDHSITTAFQNQQSNLQVGGSGVVSRILPDDNEGDRHQKFILRLSSGQTVLIAHNIDLAPRLDSIKEGDTIEFYGEYEWNSKGGVVHWTHHDPDARHEDGWLKHNGNIYK
jgi:hypothetical protein